MTATQHLVESAHHADATEATTARPIRIVHSVPQVDLRAAERAVGELLRALGQDPETEHLVDTPRRVAAAYAELLTPCEFSLTTFP